MSDHDDLKRRAQKICEMLDDIAELREDLKLEKKGAESAGYDMKALMQVVKELRSPKTNDKQLELELVLDAYREGVGLKTRSTMSAKPDGKVVEIKRRRRNQEEAAPAPGT